MNGRRMSAVAGVPALVTGIMLFCLGHASYGSGEGWAGAALLVGVAALVSGAAASLNAALPPWREAP